MPDTFTCSLVTPTGAVYETQATAAVIPADDGQLGILAHHAPLLVQLGYGTLTTTPPTTPDNPNPTPYTHAVLGGFAQFKDGKLAVLADEALATTDIDQAEAKEALATANATIAVGDPAADQKATAVRRARALVAAAS
ncbi:MAG: ATP synthase F1 subunit epsilon [Planctomycetota bacterium]